MCYHLLLLDASCSLPRATVKLASSAAEHSLDTYIKKADQGRRGLIIHLGQRAGKDNIPEDVTDRHAADEFPVVESMTTETSPR